MKKKQLLRSIFFISVLAIAILSGCSKKGAEIETEDPTISTSDVREFKMGAETSKVYFKKNTEEKIDITSFVTNVINGVLYLEPDGLRFMFDLGSRDVTDEEKEAFESLVEESGMSYIDAGFICLADQEHSVIFQNGSKLYLFDGKARMLDAPCIQTENGKYSIPITDLVFSFGYDSLGATVNGDSIIYTLIKN